MKKEENYVRCEHCDKQILRVSPPTKEQYERGQIHMMYGSLLLPEQVVRNRTRPGNSGSHCTDLSGYYCDKHCLIAHIESILKTKPICGAVNYVPLGFQVGCNIPPYCQLLKGHEGEHRYVNGCYMLSWPVEIHVEEKKSEDVRCLYCDERATHRVEISGSGKSFYTCYNHVRDAVWQYQSRMRITIFNLGAE
jgi:DNA-directed RNA polymerase subunit RPC12/RpoP